MAFITAGQASGLIALGIFTGMAAFEPSSRSLSSTGVPALIDAVHIILPLAIVIVLVSLLRNKHNAVTW
jgi:hypothetical protein